MEHIFHALKLKVIITISFSTIRINQYQISLQSELSIVNIFDINEHYLPYPKGWNMDISYSHTD